MSSDIWIFGYGSLMWNPGFAHTERLGARIWGYHRALCIFSHRYRGTVERPGLVLGLDRGGSCRGIAFRVERKNVEATIAYLDEREMVNDVYTPRWLPCRLDDGRTVEAYTYVARPEHEQYAGPLPPEKAVAYIRQGEGLGGRCLDYVANTVSHLDELGIGEGPLHRLLVLARGPRRPQG